MGLIVHEMNRPGESEALCVAESRFVDSDRKVASLQKLGRSSTPETVRHKTTAV
jgi:hypothetical protein